MGVRLRGISEADGSTAEVDSDTLGTGQKTVKASLTQAQLRTIKSKPIILVPNAPAPILVPVLFQLMFYPKPTNPVAPSLDVYMNVGVPVPGGVQGNPGLGVFSIRTKFTTHAFLAGIMMMNGTCEFLNFGTSQPLTQFGLAIWGDKDAPLVEGTMDIRLDYMEYPLPA